jgi:hypothetical protein
MRGFARHFLEAAVGQLELISKRSSFTLWANAGISLSSRAAG